MPAWLPGGLSAVAAGGAAAFLLVTAMLHLLRDDLAPGRRYLSEYAVGPHGWLMVAGFLALAASGIATAVLLARSGSPWGWGAAALMAAWGAAMVVTALVPTDLSTDPGPLTRAGEVHNLAADVAMRTLLLAMPFALLHLATRGGEGAPGLPSVLVLAALAAVAATGFLLLRYHQELDWVAPGLAQRTCFAGGALWTATLALVLDRG